MSSDPARSQPGGVAAVDAAGVQGWMGDADTVIERLVATSPGSRAPHVARLVYGRAPGRSASSARLLAVMFLLDRQTADSDGVGVSGLRWSASGWIPVPKGFAPRRRATGWASLLLPAGTRALVDYLWEETAKLSLMELAAVARRRAADVDPTVPDRSADDDFVRPYPVGTSLNRIRGRER